MTDTSALVRGDEAVRPAAAAEPDPAAFPPGFVWGASTAAYQIEGAAGEDGRGRCIWDDFAAVPGRVVGGHDGAVACDHYHRWRDDVDLVAGLGLGAYRFSVAWPRVLPTGVGAVNQKGLDFYDRLVDALLDKGIQPWPTLYHWDLPSPLEAAGGWPVRETAERLGDYAAVVAARLGDRVAAWSTVNEPWCSAFLGYGSGRHAPGRTDPADAVAAAHHLMLGHGLAVQAIRAAVPGAKVGLTLNLYPVTPVDGSPQAADAARRLDGLHNRWFLDPVLRGGYPDDVRMDLSRVTDMNFVHDGDLAVTSTPIDLLGVNYYTSFVAAPSNYPGTNAVEVRETGRPVTAMGWEVDPDGIHRLLTRVTRDYGPVPLYVHENGSAYADEVSPDGAVHDPERLSYLVGHLDACARAVADGATLAGYFAWSLMDNYEWALGYTRRFGLVHVDYATQRRTVKDSGRWYADFLRRHRTVGT